MQGEEEEEADINTLVLLEIQVELVVLEEVERELIIRLIQQNKQMEHQDQQI
jgi:hypothetical protein